MVWSSENRKEEFAARSLNQARTAAEAGNLPLASSELQRLIDAYGGTDAATEAVITLNQVRMVNGQSELAAVGLREFIQKNPPAKYLAPAYGLMGTALENCQAAGRGGRRLPERLQVRRSGVPQGPIPDRRRRAFKAGGKQAEAVAAYRTVIDSFPESPSATEAKVRLAELTDGKM